MGYPSLINISGFGYVTDPSKKADQVQTTEPYDRIDDTGQPGKIAEYPGNQVETKDTDQAAS